MLKTFAGKIRKCLLWWWLKPHARPFLHRLFRFIQICLCGILLTGRQRSSRLSWSRSLSERSSTVIWAFMNNNKLNILLFQPSFLDYCNSFGQTIWPFLVAVKYKFGMFTFPLLHSLSIHSAVCKTHLVWKSTWVFFFCMWVDCWKNWPGL